MDFIEKTRTVVATVLGLRPDQANTDAALSTIATLDSLSLAEIASALDDEFAIRLPSEDLTTELSIRDLAQLVERAPRR